MKKKLKIPAPPKPKPRRAWEINPVTRVKDSDKKYSRPTAKKNLRHKLQDES